MNSIIDIIIKILSFGHEASRGKVPQLNYGRHLIESFLNEAIPFYNVLDLGAGKGDDLMIAKKVNPIVSLHAAESYKTNIQKLEKIGVNAFSVNIERDILPFDNESIDIVIVNQVLEHTKEVFWIFHEISRVLRKGGKIIIGVPNLASLHNRVLLMLGRQPTQIKTASAHVRGFTEHDLKQFLSECFPNGYKMTGFGGSNFYPFPSFVAKPLSRLFPNASWGIFMMYEKKRNYNSEFIKFPNEKRLETNFFTGSETKSFHKL